MTDPPVFSVLDRGGRITTLDPGRAPGRLTRGLVALALLVLVLSAVAAALAAAALCSATSGPASACATGATGTLVDVGPWWLLGAVLVIAHAAATAGNELSDRALERFGQRRVASFLRAAPLLTGLAVGLAGSVAIILAAASDPGETVRLTLRGRVGTEAIAIAAALAVLAALWALAVVVRLPGALRHARHRQHLIERLRRGGRRTGGSLELGDVVVWRFSDPELRVRIVLDDAADPSVAAAVVAARMTTRPDRVPVDGSRVVVLGAEQGAVHVELDLAVAPAFAPADRYAPSE